MSPASRSQLQLLGQGRNDFQASMAKSRSGFWQAGAAGRQNPRGEFQGTGDEHLGVFRGGVFAWAEQMEMGTVCVTGGCCLSLLLSCFGELSLTGRLNQRQFLKEKGGSFQQRWAATHPSPNQLLRDFFLSQ